MTMTHTMSPAGRHSLPALFGSAVDLAERIPLSFVQLVGRLAIAKVFWASAQSKLASWFVTEQLFAMEYQLPLIDPALAARLATATEITGAVLVAFGLLSRVGALMLLGVVATIQIFVYPSHWAEHLLWASVLLLIVARGGGAISLDHLVARFFRARG